ncbi:MAG TPA: SAM-dependent chlorinase/fluorinase [Gaiellaceae bacterium]
MIVTFLTDFGLQDDFVGTCHGVVARIAPDARVIDITHGIAPQAVLQGAIVLRNTLPFFPIGVHLAVVDPGVGSTRRGVALRTRDGRFFVGPDNGLLLLAAHDIVAAHELIDPRYRLDEVSRTFHARDVFAPAAAHLASGVAIAELGPPVTDLVRLDVPVPEVAEAHVSGTVLAVDRFGNVATNLLREHLGARGATVEVRVGSNSYHAVIGQTFADVREGALLVYEDSYAMMTLAVNAGDAARLTGAIVGDSVRVTRA